ncbi:MAG: aminotransferase class IV [Siphonobacter sp.]
MASTFFLNGEFIPEEQAKLTITDLGLLRAFGIFDFFRAMDGKPIFREDHLNRFERSASLMGLTIPASREELRGIISELIRLNPQPLLGLKLVLTGGYSPDGFAPAEKANFFVVAKPFEFKSPDVGLHFMSVNHQRQLAEVKSLDYLLPIYLLREQRTIGADDVLYHKDGFITESSRSNVFLIKGNKLITPSEGMLMGITRKHILTFAKNEFDIEERPVTLEETLAADELFTTGSTKRIVPVTRIDTKLIGDGQPGPATRKLYELFLKYEQETN